MPIVFVLPCSDDERASLKDLRWGSWRLSIAEGEEVSQVDDSSSDRGLAVSISQVTISKHILSPIIKLNHYYTLQR